jgi:hypothetical protein
MPLFSKCLTQNALAGSFRPFVAGLISTDDTIVMAYLGVPKQLAFGDPIRASGNFNFRMENGSYLWDTTPQYVLGVQADKRWAIVLETGKLIDAEHPAWSALPYALQEAVRREYPMSEDPRLMFGYNEKT